jgi:formate-dependent nitrite reductase membrane component NrfD/ferredoxin
MYQRDDGIVEFDSSICIGCKACMQACPYDAIYIDPETNTAAKCHFCSHRIEVGLEPSCVVVCPTHAIISGDMDDPLSEISRTLAREQVTVRKPEQGTSPKLFYINGSDVSLHPTLTERDPQSFMWADVIPRHGAPSIGEREVDVTASAGRASRSGAPLRAPQPQGLPTAGPLTIGGRQAEHMIQVGYNAQHKVPWHWPVPAYLVTKGMASGLFVLLAVAWLGGLLPSQGALPVLAATVVNAMLLATTALLVYDLDKPTRFLTILLRPQWRSWLTRGAVLLIGFSTVAGVWWGVEVGAWFGVLGAEMTETARLWLLGLGAPFAVGAAVYTAFLFGQAEGRDLWQSALLPPHMVIQAGMAGSATLAILAAFTGSVEAGVYAGHALLGFVGADLLVILLGEFGMPHASEVAARAAHEISHGRYKWLFWVGAILVGHLMAVGLLLLGAPWAGAVAGLAALIGLYCYEHAYVMAPQEIPNS